jgi:hypothetical protein
MLSHGGGRILAFSAALSLISAPAFGAEFKQTFNAFIYGNQRLPSNAADDPNIPTVSSGAVWTDAPSGYCNNMYGFQFRRDVAGLPDVIVASGSGIRFCDPQYGVVGLSWPSAKYHFDVKVTQRPSTGSGTGWISARY